LLGAVLDIFDIIRDTGAVYPPGALIEQRNIKNLLFLVEKKATAEKIITVHDH
jgi:hypothetical protein